MAGKLTHLGKSGEARMVDVSAKPATERVAVAGTISPGKPVSGSMSTAILESASG